MIKKLIKLPLFLLFIGVCSIHIYLFVSGITLGDQIGKYEIETKRLKAENIDLEKQLYSTESLSHAASEAARLDLTKKAVPTYLDNLGIAMNR